MTGCLASQGIGRRHRAPRCRSCGRCVQGNSAGAVSGETATFRRLRSRCRYRDCRTSGITYVFSLVLRTMKISSCHRSLLRQCEIPQGGQGNSDRPSKAGNHRESGKDSRRGRHARNVKFLVDLLGIKGYSVVTATSGSEHCSKSRPNTGPGPAGCHHATSAVRGVQADSRERGDCQYFLCDGDGTRSQRGADQRLDAGPTISLPSPSISRTAGAVRSLLRIKNSMTPSRRSPKS